VVRKKRKENIVVLDSSFLGCGTVSIDKRFLPLENIVYIFGIEQRKNNGFIFTELGKHSLFFQIITASFHIQ
jgi:hypothetical protein